MGTGLRKQIVDDFSNNTMYMDAGATSNMESAF
jgi:hypothetical protein